MRASIALTALLLLPAEIGAQARLRDDLLALTGGRRVKVVWQTDTTAGGENVSGGAAVFRLRGYDTERDALTDLRDDLGDYSKPMITHDGRSVVYTDKSARTVYVIDWDGADRRELASGSHGALWLDPATGREWVYYQAGQDGSDHDAPLRRVALAEPTLDQLVWNRTPTQTEYLSVSADGARIGGCFPYPRCGIIEPRLDGTGGGSIHYSRGDPAYYSDGCWAAITPDESNRVVVFLGGHTEWAVWDYPARPGTGPDRTVDLAGAPGIDGQEVYQPRFSNHPGFFTLSGPYVGGVARGRAHRRRVEIYFGRFDEGLARVTGWVRLTHDDQADYYPAAWVEPP